MRRAIVLVAVVALAAPAAGCGRRAEPLGELTQPYPVRVEGTGDRPTVVARPPERVVALDEGPAEIVAALGAEPLLVGVPTGIATGGSAVVVRSRGTVDVDAVVGLEPDLIVATAGVDPLDLARAERESGAALYVQPAASVERVERGIIDLGFLLGRASAARALVAAIEREVARVESRLAGVAPVSVFVDNGFFVPVARRSLLGDLVDRAKGENVAGATPAPEPFPLRELVRRDPDVYLTLSGSGVTLRSLRRDSRTRSLTAVREGRVAVLPSELVTRPGPRVAEALDTVARALHPDAFG